MQQDATLSEVHAKNAGSKVFDLRGMAIRKFVNQFEAFSRKLNSPAGEIPELFSMRHNHAPDGPLFPVTFLPLLTPDRPGFLLAGTFAKMEAVLEKNIFSLTLYITKQRQASIFSPFSDKLVFNRCETPFADDLIAAQNSRKTTPWNFQRAMIAMVMCDSEAAVRGMYDELPRYSLAQNVMRCMPDALKPPAGRGRIDVVEVDGDVLREPLQKIGDLREATLRRIPFRDDAATMRP